MRLLACFLVAFLSFCSAELDDSCLACMCYVSSDGCVMPPEVCKSTYWGELCGPWAITYFYWLDAGQPGGDFYTCVADWDCNKEAVHGYMDRYVANPYATCELYARTHFGGPYGTATDSAGEYWGLVKHCLDNDVYTPPPQTN